VRPPPIVLLCVAMFATTVSQGGFPALLPEIASAGGLADWQLGTVAGAFGFARLVADLPIGLFITHHLRRALVLGPLLLIAGVLVVGSGAPFPVLVTGRFVMGVAHGLTVLAGLTAILRYRSPGVLASSLSAFELSAMLGILAGTVTLGLLPARLPWNAAFLLMCVPLAAGLLVLPGLLASLPREASAEGRPLFARPAGPRPRAVPAVVLAFTAGAGIALTYATLEHFVIPLRASRELGLDRGGIARLLMIVQLSDILCLLPAGALGDRFGTRRVLGAVLLVFSAAAVLVAFGDLALLVGGCVLFGMGMAGWTLPLALLRSATPPDRVGWRTALYRLGVDGGMFLGPFLSGLLAPRWPWLLPAGGAAALLALGACLLARGRIEAPAPRP
jgi:MFS family permease